MCSIHTDPPESRAIRAPSGDSDGRCPSPGTVRALLPSAFATTTLPPPNRDSRAKTSFDPPAENERAVGRPPPPGEAISVSPRPPAPWGDRRPPPPPGPSREDLG